jgi:hypothetical protein
VHDSVAPPRTEPNAPCDCPHAHAHTLLCACVSPVSRFRPPLCFCLTLSALHRLSQKTQDLARFVQSLNYDMYWHFSRLYYPDNFYSNPSNDYGEDTSLHILAVPHVDGSTIEGLEPVVVPPA